MTTTDKYIDLVYNWKSELKDVMNLQEKKEQAAKKLGIEIPDCKPQIVDFLSKQSHYRFTLLITRMELLEEMIESLRKPLKQTKSDEDTNLKQIKIKGDIDELCGRLVDAIEAGFKQIYGELAEAAKEQVKKTMSPEQRLKQTKI